jgi:hypothetical protein
MQRGPSAFRNRVSAVRILHEVHRLIEFDQAVEQKFSPGVVHVVVTRSMNYQ